MSAEQSRNTGRSPELSSEAEAPGHMIDGATREAFRHVLQNEVKRMIYDRQQGISRTSLNDFGIAVLGRPIDAEKALKSAGMTRTDLQSTE